MDEDRRQESPRWIVGQSIAMEIDLALSMAGAPPPGILPPELSTWLRSLPDDWRAEWQAMLGRPPEHTEAVGTAAYLAGALQGRDYSQVTLAARELTAEGACAALAERAVGMARVARTDLPPGDRLLDLLVRTKTAAYTELGFAEGLAKGQAKRLRLELEWVPRILRGGDLSARFWHWLDRFYYEFYRAWRMTRADAMRARETSVKAAMGHSGKGAPGIGLGWLPATNPLLRLPELSAAVHGGRVSVFLWVEPFGLSDSWDVWPGLVVASCAEPGALFENFQAFAAGVASRAKALADPTRLTILRLIRHFGMVNTEIAAFLGLARPTVSVHAGILERAGLIRSRREGRVVRHELVPAEVRRLFKDLEGLLDLPPEEEPG